MGIKSNKRKKFHDKDKYYRLAKEQGFRSRAAFKLSQINRKFPFLQDARIVLDLCAAPGGWTQVAARTMGQQSGAHIVAVDILPIRAFTQTNNITTIVGDITTSKCKSDITNTLKKIRSVHHQGGSANCTTDLVLHDGAPNVGASYDKDAYEQNEIAVHALRCATQHLRKGGNYITKVYRSRDYSSYLWVCQQLFQTVTAFKPKASRIQSAEIFLVCQNYKAPTKIDPKLLDPKYIFEAATTSASSTTDAATATNTDVTGGLNVFHKSWDQKRRQRGGYDMEHFDATMRHIQPVSDFIEASGMKDAIQVLSQCTGLSFHDCDFYLNHPLTTPEIKECVVDLKVLNKSDFKGLMNWREKMVEALAATQRTSKRAKGDDDDDDDEEGGKDASVDDDESSDNSDKEEEQIQGEISERIQKRLREKKRQKKKEREKAAKRRRQAALGMDLNAIDVPEHDKTFSLASITSKGELEAAAEINLAEVTDEQFMSDDDEEQHLVKNLGVDESTGYSYRLDDELDAAYNRYLKKTKNGLAKSGTKAAKRSKKVQRLKLIEEAEEDEQLTLGSKGVITSDLKKYAKMLHGGNDGSDNDGDDSSSDDDDGFHSEPLTPEEHQKRKQAKKNDDNDDHDDGDNDDDDDDYEDDKEVEQPKTKKLKKKSNDDRNPLIHQFAEEPASVKTARWFSNPLFSSIGQTAESASSSNKQDDDNNTKKNKGKDTIDVMMDSASSDSEEDNQATSNKKKRKEETKKKQTKDSEDGSKKKKQEKTTTKGISAEEVLAMMPKTDKQIRHEKRLKALEREERKIARKARQMGESEADFEVAPAENDDLDDSHDLDNLNEGQKQKILQARKLIKAGMGNVLDETKDTRDKNKNKNKLDIVAAEDDDDIGDGRGPLPIMDDRVYNSENEDYDSDDYAQTLALGTMILRKSKEKALVDASYNRYAWNDPSDLPEWFVDDENKYHRPQLPIPPALIAKMKEKMMALSAKPIAKVAEARARKHKRARQKLAAAKKKAEAVANSSDMTEAMKLKAISKTLRRGADGNNKNSKQYVVAKKGRGAKGGGKGVKVVDKRMKNDKKAMERKLKKKKNGKQGGLTGSKRRRQHS